jgi:hypothetical protein
VLTLGILPAIAESEVFHAAQETNDGGLQKVIKKARNNTDDLLSEEDTEVLNALKDAGYFDREKYQNVKDLPVNEYMPLDIENSK